MTGAAKLNSRLESEEYQTQSFKQAIKALQQECQMTAADMAGMLGIKPAAYEHMMSKRESAKIPVPVLEKLPGIFSVSLDEIRALGNAANIVAEVKKVAQPALGHWTSLVDASRVAAQVLSEKTTIR